METGTLLRPREVAERLGVVPGTLVQWRYRGTGPPWMRLGPKHIRYPELWLKRWLESMENSVLWKESESDPAAR